MYIYIYIYHILCIYVCIYMYVCMYVCMYARLVLWQPKPSNCGPEGGVHGFLMSLFSSQNCPK